MTTTKPRHLCRQCYKMHETEVSQRLCCSKLRVWRLKVDDFKRRTEIKETDNDGNTVVKRIRYKVLRRFIEASDGTATLRVMKMGRKRDWIFAIQYAQSSAFKPMKFRDFSAEAERMGVAKQLIGQSMIVED